MFTTILNFIALFGLAYVVLFAPYNLARGVSKMAGKNKMAVFFPIVNTFYVEKEVEVFHVASIAQAIAWVTMILFIMSPMLGLGSVISLIILILFAISLFLYCIFSMWTVYKILSLADINGKIGTIFYSLAFPMGQTYIGTSLYKYVNVAAKEEKKQGRKKGGIKTRR